MASLLARFPGPDEDPAVRDRLCFRIAAAALLCLAALAASSRAGSTIAWEPPVEIAAGSGEKGPWQQNDSRYRYVDDPAVAISADGSIAVAWVDQSRKDVFFRRLPADGSRATPEAVNVSRSGETFSWLPRIRYAPDRQDTLYVLWQEIIFSGGSHGGDMLFARSDDGGRSFSAPINLSDSLGGDGKGRINAATWHNGSQDIAVATGGRVYAAWTEYEGTLWFSRSTDGGKRFSRPRAVAGSAERPARAPTLAAAGDGTVYLAWTHGEDDDADIHLAVSPDGGERFGEPLVVAPGAGYADAPALALGNDGALHLAYAQSDGGPFGRFRILATRARDRARGFDAPRDVSSPLPASAVSARFPSIDTDAAGSVAVVYELYSDHRKAPRGLGISISSDEGRSFSPPALVPDSAGPPGGGNGSHQGWLMEKLALGGDGDIAIVNSSLVHGRRSRIWLMRGQAAPRPGVR